MKLVMPLSVLLMGFPVVSVTLKPHLDALPCWVFLLDLTETLHCSAAAEIAAVWQSFSFCLSRHSG